MPADLHRDPDELDRIARELRDLAAVLRPGPVPDGGCDEARRIADELDAAAAATARAASGARDADTVAAAALRAADLAGPYPVGPYPVGPAPHGAVPGG